jgi:hypothetical protein
MSDLMWSGPSRALQAHQEVLNTVNVAHTSAEQNTRGNGQSFAFAPQFVQRLNLMTSFGTGTTVAEGQTVQVRRDDFDRAFDPDNLSRTFGLLDAERTLLNSGETHYVSHNVAESVRAAGESAEPEPIFLTDLPAPSGLIVLEYPLLLPDLHPQTAELVDGLTMPIRMIGWHHAGIGVPDGDRIDRKDGIVLVLYSDHESFRTLFLPGLEAIGQRDEGFTVMSEVMRVWVADMTGWAFGHPWKESTATNALTKTGGEIIRSMSIIRRWVLSYFRWCWQRILVPEVYRPKRHEVRKLRRAHYPEDGYIKVLRLRRHVEAEQRGQSTSDGFAHDHSWIVRGHWRRQWYRSLGPARTEDGAFNTESHRLVWIEPHVSGNPFGELVVGHNVTAAVR